MYSVHKLNIFDLRELKQVSDILYDCGKDMVKTLNLHHWDNSRFKIWGIIIMCTLKNDIYLLYDGEKPVASFQTHKDGGNMSFQKLATAPAFSNTGIGSYCLTEIENLAKEKMCSGVICEVYDQNQRAKRFYEHKGYTVYGTVNTRKYRELRMRKEI